MVWSEVRKLNPNVSGEKNMNEKEALEILENESDDIYKVQIALKVAKNSLKKQIAQKPIVRGLGQRYCPVCGWGGANSDFCSKCGQKLEQC